MYSEIDNSSWSYRTQRKGVPTILMKVVARSRASRQVGCVLLYASLSTLGHRWEPLGRSRSKEVWRLLLGYVAYYVVKFALTICGYMGLGF